MFLAANGIAPPFADPARGDYRLVRLRAAIVDAGEALPAEVVGAIGGSIKQYSLPLDCEERPDDGKPDLGAYEFVAR